MNDDPTIVSYYVNDERDTAIIWVISQEAKEVGSGTGTPIHIVYISGFDYPVAGEDSQNHRNISISSDTECHIIQDEYSPGWYDDDAGEPFYGTFVQGTRYSLGISLIANYGYYFAEDCVFYLDGDPDIFGSYIFEDGSEAQLWIYPQAARPGENSIAIHSVNINGYDLPVAGEDSQNHLNITIPSDANYHIILEETLPGWYDNDAGESFAGTFVQGTRYSMEIALMANEGYCFADDCVFYINGRTDAIDPSYTQIDSENNGTAYIWTIPVAAKDGLDDMIKDINPALSESEGAIFNLAGQRLAKKQRGINIVNGKKVFVK